jgi:hypothetical protein
MKPWEDGVDEINDDEVEELWQKTEASDFIFAPMQRDGYIDICITPREYFEENGHLYDQHLQIEHLLPEGLRCEWEGTYQIEEGEPEDMARELVDLGFVLSDELARFLDNAA